MEAVDFQGGPLQRPYRLPGGVDSGMGIRATMHLRFLRAMVVLFVASAAAAQDISTPGPAEFPPLKILLAMSRTYASCQSYRDTGEVRTRSVMEDSTFRSELPFATAFVRGGPFRFTFTDKGLGESASTFILWWNGAEVRSWWDAKPGVRLSNSLQQALDVTSGLSNGASLRVPGMLLPTVVGSRPPLVDFDREADEALAGNPCFRITGRSRATPYTESDGSSTVTVIDENVSLWIDRATFLLRRVEEVRTLEGYRSHRITTYAPEINVDIPADQLAFDPPQAAGAPPTPTRSTP